MNRFKSYGLFCIFVALFLVVSVLEPVSAQQSTTGPIPPPGMDRGIRPIARPQVIIPVVPAYIWRHGCGPTAVGMVVGYWDGNGFPDLVPGDATTQTAAVNTMIADDSGNPDCDAADGDHYQDYSCPIDTDSDTALWDRSQTGGAHASNCVADFLETSWSSRNSRYGSSWDTDVPGSFTGYVNWKTPQYTPVAVRKLFDQFSWDAYKAQIDAGRPVVLLVDWNGNGDTDHFVTGIGYNDETTEYGIFNTWDDDYHWYSWQKIGVGRPYGIYSVILFRVSYQGPTLTEWGLIILVVLIVFSTWVVARRRKAALSTQSSVSS